MTLRAPTDDAVQPTTLEERHESLKPVRELREREMQERRVVLGTRPVNITLEMTARCNLTCAHCRRFHVHEEASPTRGAFGTSGEFDLVGNSGYLDEAVFEHCVDLARDADWVSMTGYGEPMMHPRFFDYARRLKQYGHTLDSITNGILLNDANVQKLIDTRFDLVSVSIDGARDETLKIVRGIGADVLFGGLERLAKAKRAVGLGRNDPPRISVNFAMGRFNIREMPELARKLSTLDVHVLYAHILDQCASPEALGPHLIHTDPVVREEAVRLTEETKAICADAGIHTDIRAIPEAGFGQEPDGVGLDSAFQVFKEWVESHPPPKRVYRPLAAIEQERRHLATMAKEQKVTQPKNGNGNGCGSNGCGPVTAAPDRLTAQELRENQRCLDFFRYAFIAWSGKVLSCCFERFAVGDLNLQTAEEVWNGPEYQRLRRGYFEEGLRWVCHGCTKYLD